MSYVDASATVSQLQTFGATFSSLGAELAQGASSGDFQDVLVQMKTALASLNGASPSASPPTVAAPAIPTPTVPTGGTGAAEDTLMSTSSLLGAATGPAMSATDASPIGAEDTSAGVTVVGDAAQYLGVPYQWGGTTPAGFDCSGLVQYVYREAGIALPRTSEEQAQVGTPVTSLADALPGDLVFFPGSDGTAASPGHVGIYIGNGEMIVAPHTGTDVQVQSVGDPTAIRRILPSSATTLADTITTGDTLLSSSGLTANGLPANLGVPAGLAPLFDQAGAAEGVSPALLAAVAKQESGFRTDAVSGAGAQGLMQLMPATAAGLGVNALDPAQAIDAAAVMLRNYLDRFGGSVPLALAAYNAGPGAVESYGGVPPYAQTQNYVASITAMLAGAEPS